MLNRDCVCQTTTTSQFQKVPNYFLDAQECESNHLYTRPVTNSRYKTKQTHFTAGDKEQFDRYRDGTTSLQRDEEVVAATKKGQPMHLELWCRNVNLTSSSVTVTFDYIFNKFKKGIFVKIVNNEVRVFLPFSCHNYQNEWASRLEVTPGFDSHIDFIEHVYKIDNERRFDAARVNRNVSAWIGNNAIVRYEYPPKEDDSGIPAFADLLAELVQKCKIPDVEFFLNKRDFPIMRRDLCEPYDHLFGGLVPLVSHRSLKYSPILGCCTTDAHADIACPTWDDWSRVQKLSGGKMFTKSNFDYEVDRSYPWEKRAETAVFRGSSTGAGVTIETNPRLKAAYMSSLRPRDPTDGLLLLDAGITSWNVRPRKLVDVPYLQTIEVQSLPFGLVARMSPREQCKYKYVLHIPGHVEAFRLSLELAMGSVILKVDTEYKIWYSHLLQPYVHFVPVKADLSDLLEKIKWCKANDDKCRKIVQNASNFYDAHLTKDGILEHYKKVLWNIHAQSCTYKYASATFFDLQHKYQLKCLELSLSTAQHMPPLISLDAMSLNDIDEEKPDHLLSSDDDGGENTKKKTRFSIADVPRSSAFLEGIHRHFVDEMKSKLENLDDTTEPLYKTTNAEIFSAYILDKNVAAKKIPTDQPNETVHEAFLGLMEINRICRIVPNFAYTFGLDSTKTYVVRENIFGITLRDYIATTSLFNIKVFLKILIQVALAIQVAQNEASFVHWDLMPWNIVLIQLKDATVFEYPVASGVVYRIESKVCPVIIDYGKSHVVSSATSQQHMQINLFTFSTVQDVLSLLISSMHAVLDHNILNSSDMRIIFALSKFFTGTRFRPTTFDTVTELKKFLATNKKFSTITTSNKFELEQRTPLDFVEFVLAHVCPDLKSFISTSQSWCVYPVDDGFGYLLIAGMLSTKKTMVDYILKDLEMNPFFLAVSTEKDKRTRNTSIRFYKLLLDWIWNLYKIDDSHAHKRAQLHDKVGLALHTGRCNKTYDRKCVPKSAASFDHNIDPNIVHNIDDAKRFLSRNETNFSTQCITLREWVRKVTA